MLQTISVAETFIFLYFFLSRKKKQAYLSRLLTGRLKLSLLTGLFDLLVLGQTVGMRRAHAARALFFLAKDFAETTERLSELDLAATLRFWVPERPGHQSTSPHHPCQVELSYFLYITLIL